MRKDYADQNDICPDCVNENNECEPSATQCDDEECCSCCCCCCSGTDSEAGDQEVNPVASDERSISDRVHAQKKDLMSSLSITRTNRERATIQHVLQFVEALTHSNNFLRRYNLQEDFCLQCLEESVRDCYIQSLSRSNLREQCTCSSCEVNGQDVAPRRIRSPADSCADCPTAPKISSDRPRTRDRRGRRRRRRTRNSFRATPEVQIRHEKQSESTQQNLNHESGSYDSDCSECRKGHKLSEPRSEQRLSECEQCRDCQNGTGTNKNVTTPHNQQRHPRGGIDNSNGCVQNSSGIGSKLSANCCSYNSNYPDSCCGSDCEDCRSSQTDEASCECCINATDVTNGSKIQKAPASSGESRLGPSSPSATSDKDSASCDCNDCRDSIECSDESCDECAPRVSQSRKSKKK